jgi:TRAF-interacting protein
VNNISNIDSEENSENLIERIDNLALSVREKDIALKKKESECEKYKQDVKAKETKIKKLDASVFQCNQVISTMRHEIDILKSNRASYQAAESENQALREKVELMQTIESVLTASQKEVDEVLKQNLSPKDLAVMVGTLRRELNSSESKKNELRKQLQMLKNNLRAEQDQKQILKDRLNTFESENIILVNKLKKYESKMETINLNSPELPNKRMAVLKLDEQNTPSPLSRDEFDKRVRKIHESESPYLKVKSSSIALACMMKKSGNVLQDKSNSDLKHKTNDNSTGISIFKKPRLNAELVPMMQSKDLIYNGLGGTSKVLQSDLLPPKQLDRAFNWPHSNNLKKTIKKKLSAAALNK